MELLEVVGFSRSGLHAVINWFLKNLTNYEAQFEYKLDMTNGKGVFYINEANLDSHWTLKYIEDHAPNAKFMILCYENVEPHYTLLNDNKKYDGYYSIDLPSLRKVNKHRRLHIVRNFYDNLASRVKANRETIFRDREGNPFHIEAGENFINLWKEQVKYIIENEVDYLKFEDWCLNKSYRNDILKNIVGINEIYDNRVMGTTSSFGNNQNLFNRKDLVDLDDKTIDLIKKDNELHYLLGKMGYEYVKI